MDRLGLGADLAGISLISDGLRKRIDEAIKAAHRWGRTYSVPATSFTYGDWSWNLGDTSAKRSSNGQYKGRTKMGQPLC